MLEVLVVLGATIGVVAFLIQVIFRWGTVQLTREIELRMRAAETIVNHDRLPEAWLRRDRESIAAMRRSGRSQIEIDQAGSKALAGSLKRIDDLIRFFESSPLVDSAESREVLLHGLREHRRRFAEQGWAAVFDTSGV